MGGKGAKGGQSTNDAIVAMQQQAATQAKQANAERNARLSYGKQNIMNAFEGAPAGATPYDFSSISDASRPKNSQIAMPAVMSQWLAQNPGTPPPDMTNYTRASLPGGYSWGQLPDDGSGVPQYGLFDTSGAMVNSGSTADLAASKIYGPGGAARASPFGQDFYDKYTKSILDYYTPQENQQYADARTGLSASLARAGTLDSSLAAEKIAGLSKQDQLNLASIRANADSQTGQLRTTISQDEQAALNQLYSTEDPSVAANTAQNMVANAALTKPLLNPAGALFAPITVGVGNALTGFINPTAYINPNAASAATTTGNQSAGYTGQG